MQYYLFCQPPYEKYVFNISPDRAFIIFCSFVPGSLRFFVRKVSIGKCAVFLHCVSIGTRLKSSTNVFVGLDDGLFYVKEGDKIFSEENGNVGGAEGLAVVPKGQEDAVVESAEECPGECIMIEP